VVQKTPFKNNTKMIVAIGVVCVLIIAGLTWAAITYFPHPKTTETQDTFVPTLEPDLQSSDDRTNPHAPFLHVTGSIYNSGNGTANNIVISVYAIQNGNVTAIDKTANLDPIDANQTQEVDLIFDYTGEALLSYSSPTLDWTN
jgi:hypothetical protein